ncbi:MAG: hypothetical protein U5K72_01115 [Balneolaceae bacterium]|nr:hypothetical protein [Balneolaceae bacterium]
MLLFALFLIIRTGSEETIPDSILVFTKMPAAENHLAGGSENVPPDYKEARIVSLNYENPESGIKNLTSDFYSATSPSLSFDNQLIVFSAKVNQNDSWQIWTMNLDGSAKKKVFESSKNCYTPSFLPTGDIVFSCEIEDPEIGKTYPLFKILEDGSGLNQLTFHPHRDFYPSILYDGRIAIISQQFYPTKKSRQFMVLRPDGTKSQAFYHDQSDSQIKSTVRESREDKLIFVQGDGNVDELVVLSYANPLLPKEIIATYDAGAIQSAGILDSTRLVISAKSGSEGVFGLSAISFKGDEELIYKDEGYHSVQPVVVRKQKSTQKVAIFNFR